MAKIFYLLESTADYERAWFFNNKKKAIEKGMEVVEDFEYGTEIELEDEELFYKSGEENIKDGFAYYTEYDGTWSIEDMTEEAAREMATSTEDMAGVYFPAKLKGGYGEAYIGSASEHTNAIFTFDGGAIEESKKEVYDMKSIQTFEAFTNTVNEKKITVDWNDDENSLILSDEGLIKVDYDGEFQYRGKWFSTAEHTGPEDLIKDLTKAFKGDKFVYVNESQVNEKIALGSYYFSKYTFDGFDLPAKGETSFALVLHNTVEVNGESMYLRSKNDHNVGAGFRPKVVAVAEDQASIEEAYKTHVKTGGEGANLSISYGSFIVKGQNCAYTEIDGTTKKLK